MRYYLLRLLARALGGYIVVPDGAARWTCVGCTGRSVGWFTPGGALRERLLTEKEG